MDAETKKIIQDQMKNLPQDVKEAIISVDYTNRMQEITRRQKLLIDQAAKLEMETTLVLIGLEPLTDYISNLQRELVVNEIRAREVALDVSENVFKPIRESLKRMNSNVLNEKGEVVDGSEILSEDEPEPPAPRFTDSNETSLNRDQILKEIEDPAQIDGGDRSMNFAPVASPKPENLAPTAEKKTELEVKPAQEIQIRQVEARQMETIPGQIAKDVTQETGDMVKSKMTGTTIVSQQIIDVKPDTKLPEIEKKRPSSGADPYREPII